MNTQANAMPETPLGSQVAARAEAAIPATHLMYWAVLRELWESRSIYLAPLVVGGLMVFGFLISTTAGIWEKALALDLAQQRAKLAEPYLFAGFVMMATTFVVGVFYCLDALHGERRDRSILFWKSLPVSDLTTVLAKFSIPLVVLPLICFVITLATQIIMLMLSSAVLLAKGDSVLTLWTKVPFFQMSVMLLYHLVTAHGLWYAPIYAWLLLVSA